MKKNAKLNFQNLRISCSLFEAVHLDLGAGWCLCRGTTSTTWTPSPRDPSPGNTLTINRPAIIRNANSPIEKEDLKLKLIRRFIGLWVLYLGIIILSDKTHYGSTEREKSRLKCRKGLLYTLVTYLKVNKSIHYRVTDTGLAGTLYNGVADWLYEGKNMVFFVAKFRNISLCFR